MANNKKYISLNRLSNFLDNLRNTFALLSHKHTVADLTDYTVDSALSSTSTNPVQNSVLNEEFESIATAMNALDLAIDGKADASHDHNDVYYTETEIDAKLSDKSDKTHNHDSDYADINHNHDDVYSLTDHHHDSKYDAKGTASSTVSTHNTSTSAHNDIRDLITGLTTRLNTLANSDDTTLDQMSELVAYIKNNKSLIDGITTSKINVSDIVNNLTTNTSSKVLSAAQGVAIKSLIDALQTELDSHTHSISDVSGLQSALDGKAAITEFDTHVSDTTKHITSTERTNWETAYTHSQSAHAPSNAEKNQNAFSNVKVGSTTVAADTATDTLELVGSNVTITPDATNDKITFTVADGSTSAKGVVQLTNSTSSTSTTTAATPSSVKSAYDLANTANTNAATAQTKADSAYTLAESKVDSLSDLGITATATELNYMDGVTSNVQTQLDTKADTIHTHPYGVCSSSATYTTKTVTVDNFSLVEGARVIIKFTNANSASSPKLNVNGTGAIPIMRYGTTAVGSNSATNGWEAGAVLAFTYDGTNWVRDYWHNTTYTNIELGQGFGYCYTSSSVADKEVTMSNYEAKTGGIVSVKFSYSVDAGEITMNINGKGAKPVNYMGSDMIDDVIKGGDIATFIYTGSTYHLISVDRWFEDIAELQANDSRVRQMPTTTNGNFRLLLTPSFQSEEATAYTYFNSNLYANPYYNKIYADISGTSTGVKGVAAGNFLVGNGFDKMIEKTPAEVLSLINGASVRSMTTAEYNALGANEINANTLYMLTDGEEEASTQVQIITWGADD